MNSMTLNSYLFEQRTNYDEDLRHLGFLYIATCKGWSTSRNILGKFLEKGTTSALKNTCTFFIFFYLLTELCTFWLCLIKNSPKDYLKKRLDAYFD